ncbi:MAG: 3-oxoacyl-ACP synthase [Epsilonproteobacteria bacterium]|nr:MAG: 3-oxoacyl-ACP synthase [Campylobacterota bacterium]
MALSSKIIGVGSYVPPKSYTNFDLEEMMDTSHDWIVQRSGIEKRHWVEDECTSDLALQASLKALKAADMSADQLDMIIFATISPDHEFPGTACFLQQKLGISKIPAIDIRQQCTGFIYGLSMADVYIKSGQYKNILLVGAEVHSKGLDKTPNGRAISVLFGDGAGAVVLTATKDSGIFHTELRADGNFAKELWTPAPGSALGKERISKEILDKGLHYAQMNGKLVFVHAVKRMSEILVESLKKSGFSLDDVDLFLFHQANLRINNKVAEVLNIPEEKVFNTIQEFGNTTAATIPLGMDQAIKTGVLKPGMLVAMAAFGGGFTWGASVIRF